MDLVYFKQSVNIVKMGVLSEIKCFTKLKLKFIGMFENKIGINHETIQTNSIYQKVF